MRKGSDFIFENVELLDYRLHKISLKRGKSYIESPEWLRSKRATINLQNNDDKCFQYALTVELNHQNIRNNSERISNIKPFINQYNLKDINIKEDRGKLEKKKKIWQLTGKSLHKIIRQLLLISYLYPWVTAMEGPGGPWPPHFFDK